MNTPATQPVLPPVPVIDPGSAPYWEALGQHRLMLKRCNACGKAHFYPRELCPYCYADGLVWFEASGLGAVYSFTVCHRPAGPAFTADVPYVVALVELAEGPRMMTRITGDAAAVAIGRAVRVRFEQQTEMLVLPFFEMMEQA
jgi:uncharacterized protein